jgi:hypothetical protein
MDIIFNIICRIPNSISSFGYEEQKLSLANSRKKRAVFRRMLGEHRID